MKYRASPDKERIPLDQIMTKVAFLHGLNKAEVIMRNNARRLVACREHFMFLAHEVWGYSYPEIAAFMGRSSHSTAIQAVARVRERHLDAGGAWLILTEIFNDLSSEERQNLISELEQRHEVCTQQSKG